MTFTYQELIDAARTYVDDDHEEDDGWLSPEKWLRLANVEYAKLYRQWVRMGLITPVHTVATTTGSTMSLTRVLCIIGVGENVGNTVPRRILDHGDQRWDSGTGKSSEWTATGTADSLTVTLYPADTGATYECRYIQYPAYATLVSSSVDVPYGAEERLILGMARRALIKESAASRRIDEEILAADAELNMLAFGRKDGDSPRVRRVNDARHRVYPVEPGRWVYFA